MNKVERIRRSAAYEHDLALWSQEQAALIRSGRFEGVDLENVAEEIESLGRSDRREIENRLKVLLVHLLKLRFQPQKSKSGWVSTVVEQRRRILNLIAESPSLRSFPETVLSEEYRFARSDAAGETKLDLSVFPEACPFTIAEILDLDFYPEAAN